MSDSPDHNPSENLPTANQSVEFSDDAVSDAFQPNISRRKFIIGSSIVGLSVLGAGVGYQYRNDLSHYLKRLTSSNEAPSEQPKKPHQVIPNTATVKAYRKFLNHHRVQYLSADELLRPHFKTRGGVQSGIPPESLWSNMLATRRVADEIRRRLGVPLHTVASAYRSPQYNAKCPGASKYSQHLKNCALDVVYACPPRAAFDAADQLRKEGFFKGGLGLYNSFIHIDTRGRNATWGV